ncbi:MAG: hypothetical protein R3F38_17360 [Gammaproteobacteria bacterium]
MNAYLQKRSRAHGNRVDEHPVHRRHHSGQFLYATAEIVQITSTLAFMEGKAFCGGKLIGTGSGVWKYLHSTRIQQQTQQQQ